MLNPITGDVLVDAPIVVSPISFHDTGSGVFTVALAALALGADSDQG